MNRHNNLRLRLLLGSALMAAALPAFAQAQTAAVPQERATIIADPEGPVTGLGDIIVTATKRETDLQKTPIAISVIGGEALDARHADSLIALQDGSVPSLRIATFEARQSALTVGIRGIVPFDANQTARDQGVGVYIDGVYLGRQQGLNAALFDVQRIEVLRGPQGTLFGRNTEGGALSIVTRAPTGVFGGRITAGGGNFGEYDAEIHQNFQSFGNLAIKFDGLIQHQDPTIRNPMDGQAGWNRYDRHGARITGLFTPTDTFSAEISADYAEDQNTPFFSQLVNFNPYGKRVRTLAEMTAVAAAPAGTINALAPLVQVHTDRQTVSDIGTVQQPSEDKTGGVSATLKWSPSDNLEIRSITAARDVATHQWDNSGIESRNVFAPNALFGRYSLSDLDQRQFSQEFQAVGNLGDSFEYVAGVYYFNEHVTESAASPITNQWNADGTDFTIRTANGTSPLGGTTAGWNYGTRFLIRASRAEATSSAVYGQGTFTPPSMQALHITLGGRFSQDKRDGTLYLVNAKPTNFVLHIDDNRFDPMINIAYEATPDINLYAKYSTGYRAGGANDRSATFAAFGAEETKSYEIGAKMDLLDNRVRLNLAAYAMNRDGTQIDFDAVDTTPGSPTQGAHTEETRNASGTSKIRGFEADLQAMISENVTVGLAYAYTDVKIPSTPFPFAGNPDVPQGSPFPVNVVYTPPNAASAYIDYNTRVGDMTFRAHLDAAYADAQFAFQSEFADVSPTGKLVQNVAVKTDSSFIVNGSIALADINMGAGGATGTLSFWTRNLLDESHIYRISAANRGQIGDYANFNPPRTFGLQLSIDY